ncbi:MAG: hypothetical protein U5K74_07120 [Gemmatimonadaceae bacterium]|nr:hypothetical protein [Gemmatimonadaceae bacterium]
MQIVITDAAGDTMRTLNGPGAVGVHRVMWDMRGKAPAARPLSPAERRDSARTVTTTLRILDSLQTSGMDSNMVRMVRTSVLSGRTAELIAQFGGGGGGGGAGQAAGLPAFVERPGEGAAAGAAGSRGAAGRAGGAPAAGGAPGAAGPPSQAAMGQIFQAFRGVPGALFGRGGRGGGGAPLVNTGAYLVTFVYGDEKQKQVLRIERVGGLTGASGFGAEDDEADDESGIDRR